MGYLEDLKRKTTPQEQKFSLYPPTEDAELRLELTNACNHRCCFCINSSITRKIVHMEDDMIYRIIREAAELGVKKAGYFMNGEPFLSKRLADYVRVSKEAGIEYVYITTNGALATPERLTPVLEAGLDSLKFSINAGTPESYRLVHGRDDYEAVMENLKFAHQYREKSGLKYRILSSCVVTRQIQDEVELHAQNVEPYVDDLVFFQATNFAGQVVDKAVELSVSVMNPRIQQFAFAMQPPCKLLSSSINVTCEGYLTLCCSEANNMMVVEDLRGMSLKEAWHSARMTEMRQRHIENRLEGTQCYNCIHNINSPVKPLNEALYQACQKG